MAGPGSILIKIGADASQAVRELGKTDKALGSTMSTSEKMGAGVKKAALPAAVALGAIAVAAVDATKAAAEDAAAQEHLSGVLKRTAGATDETVASTEDWIAGVTRATGVTDDELRPAMETLVTATGDVAKAQTDMKDALDISAASGKSVAEVSKAMALAHTGQTAKLEKLVPGLSAASKESDDMTVIMGELAEITGGAMAESADTAAGQFKIFQAQTGELKESLGAALLPVVTALTPLLVKLADVAAENTGVIKVLIGVVAGLGGRDPGGQCGHEALRGRLGDRQGGYGRVDRGPMAPKRGAERQPNRANHHRPRSVGGRDLSRLHALGDVPEHRRRRHG